MIYARGVDGEQIQAVRDTEGWCPGCGQQLIPKCGEIVIHHWAHRAGDCDPWYEPESEWHLGWKRLVRPSACEVPLLGHRADIVGNKSIVIELQHSLITAEEALVREAHYGNMLWVIDAEPFWDRLWLRDKDGRKMIWWRHPRPVQEMLGKPLYWHMPNGDLLAVAHYAERPDNRCWGWGHVVTKDQFIRAYLSDVLAGAKVGAVNTHRDIGQGTLFGEAGL